MEADNASPDRPAPLKGGTVEPANRATVAKEQFQTPLHAGERYELHDPFSEVTYRVDTIPEIVEKAKELGSSRFIAVAPDGQRTMVDKVEGAWQRGGTFTARVPPEPDTATVRDEVPQATTKVVPMQPAAGAPARPEPFDSKVVAKVDAEAERAALVARIETALVERYLIKKAPVTVGNVTVGRTEYRFRGDTSRVAFTESTFRLATDTNSPSVARSMVDVAQARNWHALRVSGNEEFRRMVWLEASVRGVKALGYEPNPADLDVLKKEREARLVNRIEPAREAGANDAAGATAGKGSARGSGGRKSVLVAIEALLVAKGVPEKQREAVMAAATTQLAQRQREGQAPKVKVYDKAAPPPERSLAVPLTQVRPTRDRAAPVR